MSTHNMNFYGDILANLSHNYHQIPSLSVSLFSIIKGYRLMISNTWKFQPGNQILVSSDPVMSKFIK